MSRAAVDAWAIEEPRATNPFIPARIESGKSTAVDPAGTDARGYKVFADFARATTCPIALSYTTGRP